MAISSPAALRVSFTTIPAFLGRDSGTPLEYFGLGRINVGTSLGYMQHVDIVCSPQLVLDLPRDLTVVAWDFAPGVVASIQELVESAAAMRADPWDRAPTVVNLWAQGTSANVANTTAWSYTVPAGRRLMVGHLAVTLRRVALATTPNQGFAWVERNGGNLLMASLAGGVAGTEVRDALSGGAPLVLGPAETLVGKYQLPEVTGSIFWSLACTGFLFDV